MKIEASGRSAFSLVEIMIVVGLIALLAVVAIPNYVRSRTNAQVNICISNLREIQSAIQSWALEAQKDSGEAVTYDDIKGFLKHSVVCPAGGTSFDDSYHVTVVKDVPTCLRQPGSHELPL